MENKFVCGYCGKEYETPHERSMCEQKCYKEVVEAERKAKIEELNAERKLDETRINKMIEKLNMERENILHEIAEYEKKYNRSFTVKNISTFNDLLDCFWRF